MLLIALPTFTSRRLSGARALMRLSHDVVDRYFAPDIRDLNTVKSVRSMTVTTITLLVVRPFRSPLRDHRSGKRFVGLFKQNPFGRAVNIFVLPASQRLENALRTGSQVTKEIVNRVRQGEEEASSPFKQNA